jgi:N-acetylmuramate 1-kinase
MVLLAADASFRRYFRVALDDRRAILMDAPPPLEDPRPFLAVADWLTQRGFAAPAIYAVSPDRSLVLLEDFGDERVCEAVNAAPEAGVAYYEAAVDMLVELARHPAGPFDPYDREVLRREVGLLTDFYCPAIGLTVDEPGFFAAWDAVFDHALTAEPVTVLRDFHAENLMLVGPDKRLGLLDFQDALAGHPAYDLVSLLQDARRDVDPNVEERMLQRYRAATGVGEAFMTAYHVLGAQRNAKIIGIFTRLWKRDGKTRYPTLCPRVWGYLERGLTQPVLNPVARWFDDNIPPEQRGDPLALAGERAA